MSEYRRLRAVELQEECERRGIDPSGLNKRGMINALHDDDELNNDGDEVRASGGNVLPNGGEVDGDNGDGEVRFRAPTQRGNGHVFAISGGSLEEEESDGASDSSVAVMQLKLQLAREERERERERYEMQRERDERTREMREREFQIDKERAELTGMGGARPGTRGDLCHLLPKMSDNDPLVFFFCF